MDGPYTSPASRCRQPSDRDGRNREGRNREGRNREGRNRRTAVIGVTPSDVWKGWQRLHDAHALVLQAHTRELRMANPFSAVPTAYRVFAHDRWWYANCAWDAFGICAALHVDGRIEASCADCGDPIVIEVRSEQPDDTSLLFHCAVPAAQWWDDIVFT